MPDSVADGARLRYPQFARNDTTDYRFARGGAAPGARSASSPLDSRHGLATNGGAAGDHRSEPHRRKLTIAIRKHHVTYTTHALSIGHSPVARRRMRSQPDMIERGHLHYRQARTAP